MELKADASALAGRGIHVNGQQIYASETAGNFTFTSSQTHQAVYYAIAGMVSLNFTSS